MQAVSMVGEMSGALNNVADTFAVRSGRCTTKSIRMGVCAGC